jgi:SAM-dependent methyltransferase
MNDVGSTESPGNSDVGSTESPGNSDEASRLVAAGYDAMADTWESWSAAVADDPRHEWLESLLAALPKNAAVVELGCGNGTRETRELAARAQLTGVDLSGEQLRRARERVPQATFVQGDLATIEFEPASLDAVVAFYVFNHVPRELLAGIFGRIHSWLRPGGQFLAALGAGDVEGWQGEWLGVPMFFSSYSAVENRRLLSAAGLDVQRDEVVTMREPEGDATFLWVICRAA